MLTDVKDGTLAFTKGSFFRAHLNTCPVFQMAFNKGCCKKRNLHSRKRQVMSGMRTGHKSARRRRKSSRCKKEYCALEGRRLLAVTASLSGSTLSIFGDASANTVVVTQSGSSLNLSGDLSQQYNFSDCLLYTSPSPRDATLSRMPSSA